MLLYIFLDDWLIAQIFVLIVEIAIPSGTPTNEADAKIEAQPLRTETKTRTCSK